MELTALSLSLAAGWRDHEVWGWGTFGPWRGLTACAKNVYVVFFRNEE